MCTEKGSHRTLRHPGEAAVDLLRAEKMRIRAEHDYLDADVKAPVGEQARVSEVSDERKVEIFPDAWSLLSQEVRPHRPAHRPPTPRLLFGGPVAGVQAIEGHAEGAGAPGGTPRIAPSLRGPAHREQLVSKDGASDGEER